MEASCWFCLMETFKIIYVRSSKKLTGMLILQGVGSNRAICRNFTKSYVIKTNSWKKLLMVRNWNTPRATVPSCSERAAKAHPFSKISRIGSTGSRVLLLVKLQALIQNESTNGVFLKTFRQFPEHLGIINLRNWYF